MTGSRPRRLSSQARGLREDGWSQPIGYDPTAIAPLPPRSVPVDGATIYRVVFGEDVQPDAWQLELTTDVWPRVLVAPTGSDKTAAVTLGWAAHRIRNPKHTPRRLVWCLPMRTLVEQTANAVSDWFAKLVADVDGNGRLPKPEDVHVLMGGEDASGWLDHPERPAVLVGTQDMLLSRALMRGYASSRALWPMEFALLHEDAQWVFDEVQLMGAGRATSAQLDAFRQSEADRARREDRPRGTPSLSLWISATLDPHWLATVDYPEPPAAAVVRVDPAAAPDGDLFDTDPDLTGFDVDVSPYVRDADDTYIRVFWQEHPSAPHRSRRCAGCGHRFRSSQLVLKDRCGEASGRPTICGLPAKRHGGSHAATRWNAMAP